MYSLTRSSQFICYTGAIHGQPQTKSHQFRCTDKNTSLYFVVYEKGGSLSGGHMYVENM